MADKTVLARLKLDISGYLAGLGRAGVATAEFGKQVSGAGTASTKSMQAVGHGTLLMAAGMAAGLGLATKAAMDWESAWAGVTKTVSGNKAEMAELEDGLRGLARTLPATHKEIAAVAEAAGQLGIKREAIVDFTETMVALGVSTNLSADQAATGIAQIANVMQTSQGDLDRFGSTLVALGNVGASTESEILEMAKRLAGAGKLVGASEADVLALANAMSSMGIEAQLGGGAFSRVMLKIYSAVQSAGDKLEGFASVAGMSAESFAAAFEDDPIRAIDGLIKGLDEIDRSGGNVVQALADLGFKGTQDLQVLLRLKGAGDLLTESLDLGSKAWLENTALTEEANKRYDTAASRLRIAGNQMKDVAIDAGAVLLPALKAATSGVSYFVSGLAEIDGVQRTVIVALAGMATTVTGLIGLLGTFGPKIAAFRTGLMDMGSAGQFVGRNLGTIATGLGLAGAALTVYTLYLGQNAKEQREAEARARGFTDAIAEQGAEVGRTTDELALNAIMAGDLGEALRNAGVDLSGLLDGVNNTGAGARQMRDDLEALAQAANWHPSERPWEAWRREIDRGRLDSVPGLRDALITLQDAGLSGDEMRTVIGRLLQQNQAYKDGKQAARNKAAAEDEVSRATGKSSSASERAKKALEDQAAAAEQVTDAIKDMIDAEHAALDPLFGMLDAAQGNRDALRELSDAYKANSDDIADNNLSLEELETLQRAAAKSAFDMDGAALQLAGSIANGTTNLDTAKQSLRNWVDAGLISKDTAADMERQFEEAATKADLLAADRVGSIVIEGLDETNAQLDAMLAKLREVGMFAAIERETRGERTGDPRAPVGAPAKRSWRTGAGSSWGQAGGGWAGAGQRLHGPSGTDVIPTYLSPGEYTLNAQAAAAIGPSNLQRLNSMRPGSMFTGSGSTPSSAGTQYAGSPGRSGGDQVQYHYVTYRTEVGQVVAHDYNDFQRQMKERQQIDALSGMGEHG